MARVAIMLDDNFEDNEFHYPNLRCLEAGHDVDVIAADPEKSYTGKKGTSAKATLAASKAKASDYAMVIVPGGTSPDHMRRHESMVRFIRDVEQAQVPVAAICHGLWLLCSTNMLRGKRCTSFYSIAHDVANAGGEWVDKECVVDGKLITSRFPTDLPSFLKAALSMIAEGHAQGVTGEPLADPWVSQSLSYLKR